MPALLLVCGRLGIRPFTDKIYSSAAAKKKRDQSTATSTSNSDSNKVASAPVSASSSGISRSNTSAKTRSDDHVGADDSSYASAVADRSSTNSHTLPSTDPRPQVDLSHLGLGAPISPSGSVIPGVGDPKLGVMDGNSAAVSSPTGRNAAGRTVTRSRSRARIVDDD